METSQPSFHHETYHRVPMNSATTRTESNDFNSLGSYSTYSAWSRSLKRTATTTTYIDGATMLNQYGRSYDLKNFFPKGKNRQKPLHSTERKNARDAYMSLLPADTNRVRSPRSTVTAAAQNSTLPDVLPKSANRLTRPTTTTIFDDDSQTKFYVPHATTHTNNAWVRRFKSINESQILSNFLRDQMYPSRVLLKKRPYKQFVLSSTSSIVSINSPNRRQLEKYPLESKGTINHDESYAVDDEENNDSDLTGRIIADSYRIQSKLGAGSFGQVYLCENIHTNEQWAIKIELNNKTNRPILESEYEIYRVFENVQGFPKIDYFNREDKFNILVIELLGPSLEDLFNYCNRKFSLKTALMLVDQMITRIEYVHTCHLVHRDIKPDNFLMGTKSNGNTVYIIDFGLSKRYRDPQTFVHIPLKNNRNLTGTARYASINAHKGNEQSRRDDLEAISYVFMYFLLGTLPWQGLQATARKAKFERIAEMKMKLTAEQICKNQPKECSLFVNYCRTLPYDHRPDYDYLRHLFRYLLYRTNEQYDFEYDWLFAYQNRHMSALTSSSDE